MKLIDLIKRPGLKSVLMSVFLMVFLAGCSSGGGGGGGQSTETIKMNGTASIPSSISSSKSGILNKLLPGTVALENAVVNAKSLTTGFSHPALAPVSGGSFSIEVPKVSDYYLVTALKGNILMMKLVFIDAGAGSPIDIGEIDSASTSVVLMTERFFEEILRRERVELHSDLPGDLDPTLLSQLLNIALIDVREKELELRNLVENTIDETGAVNVDANLDDIFTTEGEVDTDNIASINIYITIQQIIIQLGNLENNEDVLDVITTWINGGSVNITAETIVNFFGDISIVNNIVTPADLQDHLNIISKPETSITEKWEDASRTQELQNPTTSTNATFSFTSSRGGSAFDCRLDAGAFTGCNHPIDYSGLEPGPHTFCVKATDIDGNTDPSPACFTWTINGGAQLGSIAVTPANPSIVVGATQQFTATGTFTDSSTRDLTNSVTWGASGGSSKATIDVNGIATGVSKGATTITATDSGTGVAGSTTLTITTGLDLGLVAYYPFNANANDESGNGNDGTVNGAILTTDRFGDADSAYSFDGNDSIDVPDDPMFTFGSDPFTISSWVRLSSLGGYYLMGHDEGGGDRKKWIFWLGTEGISIIIGPGGGWNPIGTTTPFETNRWYHVAIRREADVFTAFVDGVSIGSISKAITIQDPNTTFQIGTAEPEHPERTFRGSIDDVRIYDRALSNEEMSILGESNSSDLQKLLDEDFEDDLLDSKISIETLSIPLSPDSTKGAGIKNTSALGSLKAYGFGRSSCGVNCFNSFTSTLKIIFSEPTFVSKMDFKYMELFDNWGSNGTIFIDGVSLTGGRNFQGVPSNGRKADTTFTQGSFMVNKVASTLELRVVDITNLSEIYIDDLVIYGE